MVLQMSYLTIQQSSTCWILRYEFFLFLHLKVIHELFSQVELSDNLINEAEALGTPPDHEVFQLVPPLFDQYIRQEWTKLGSPKTERYNVWHIYAALFNAFHVFDSNPLQNLQLIFTQVKESNWMMKKRKRYSCYLD